MVFLAVSKPTVLMLRHKTALPPKPAQMPDSEDYSGFDESAYLAGNIAILSGERHARKTSAGAKVHPVCVSYTQSYMHACIM